MAMVMTTSSLGFQVRTTMPRFVFTVGQIMRNSDGLTPFDGAKSDGIDLAVGDMNGDNFADIIVSQLRRRRRHRRWLQRKEANGSFCNGVRRRETLQYGKTLGSAVLF